MRLKIVSAVLSALFVLLLAGLAYTQLLKNTKYTNLSRTNRVRLVPQEGRRGRLFDRNGVLLVGSRPSFDVVVIPQELENSVATLSRVGELLGAAPAEIFKRVEKNYVAPFAPISIKEDIERQKAIAIEEEALALRGVAVKVTSRREYKFNEAGSHIFGYLGEIEKGELERLRGYGYQVKDLIGKSGLEKNYDNYLKGEGGGLQLEVDNRGYFVRQLGKKEVRYGKDIVTNIDIRLQLFIEKAMADKAGACIVMLPDTGEVLALASMPNFNPTVFIDREREGERAAFLNGPRHPMFNRAVSGLYSPGSVFKPIIAIAALEKRRLTDRDIFTCPGRYVLGGQVFECWDEEGHGGQGLADGLKNSCNVFFYQVGRLVGVDDIFTFATRFGYGAPTGIDLPEEAAGLVPNRLWKRLARKMPWFEGDTLNFSIGQGYLLVTPIQVLRMMAALANGGTMVEPQIVKKIDNIEVSTGRFKNAGVSRKTLDELRAGLRKVVMDEAGTGRRARAEGLEIAGKTGTAQNPRGQAHAWFAGFAPVENPKLALVVFIEHGGKGGLEAAELAGQIFKEAMGIGLL